jgi:hypothetical protein
MPMFLSYMASGGQPFVNLLLPLTILMEIGCGLTLSFGKKSIYTAVILALFTIPTTAIFHALWSANAASFLKLDLPLRVVRENTDVHTLVAYHPAPAMTNAALLTNGQLAGFSRVEALIADTVMHK